MKKIIQPKQEERAEYVSDISNISFNGFSSDVEVKFEFNYGSEFDGSKIEFHLTDPEAKSILSFIRGMISEEKKQDLKNKIKISSKNYNDNIEARDWESSDYYGNEIELYRYLLNE